MDGELVLACGKGWGTQEVKPVYVDSVAFSPVTQKSELRISWLVRVSQCGRVWSLVAYVSRGREVARSMNELGRGPPKRRKGVAGTALRTIKKQGGLMGWDDVCGGCAGLFAGVDRQLVVASDIDDCDLRAKS